MIEQIGSSVSPWSSVSTLPYEFNYGSAVVYNNEIHILGGTVTNSNYRKHYKWNGSSWSSVSTLPYDFYQDSAVVYNNEIHILGSYSISKKHYKWNGSSWSRVSTLPHDFYDGSAVVYNNEIHILGGCNYTNNSSSNSSGIGLLADVTYNGQTWNMKSRLPYAFSGGSAVVYNNEIHILGGVTPLRADIDQLLQICNNVKHYMLN